MHPYKAWLKERGLTLAEGAARLNKRGVRTRRGTLVTKLFLSQLFQGYRGTTWSVARGIEADTGRRVSARAVMEWEPDENAPSA